MQGKVLIVLLLVFIAMANAISVYTLDEQFSQTNQTVLRFKVENNSFKGSCHSTWQFGDSELCGAPKYKDHLGSFCGK